MKKDKRTIEEIKKNILLLQEETNAIKKNGEKELIAIRKKGEDELNAIRKETEAIKKKGEDELNAIRKETEAIKKKGEDEVNAIRKETEAIRKESEVIRKENDELGKKIDERLDKLIGKTDDTNARLNGLDKNIGYGVEELFFESINKTKQIGNIVYDECTQNVPIFQNLRNTNSAIDILLVNGKDVGIIEVKHRVGIKAVEQLLKTAELFKMNNNLKKYTLNLYIAGLSLHPSAHKAIKDNKIGFIKIRGEHFELIKNVV